MRTRCASRKCAIRRQQQFAVLVSTIISLFTQGVGFANHIAIAKAILGCVVATDRAGTISSHSAPWIAHARLGSMAERATAQHEQEPDSLEGDGAPLLGESTEIDESVRDDGAPRLLAVLNWWDGVGVSVGVVVSHQAKPGSSMHATRRHEKY